jgi:hypothetical protein
MAKASNNESCRHYVRIVLASFLALLIPTWVWVWRAPLAYQGTDYAIIQAKIKLARSERPWSLVILGDSCGVTDLCPRLMGPRVVNLALGGASPVETYYMAREMLAAPHPPEAVLLTIMPEHFLESNVFWSSYVPCGFISFTDANEVRKLSRALDDHTLFNENSPGDIDARLKLGLMALHFPAYSFPSLVQSRYFGRYSENRQTFAKLLADRGWLETHLTAFASERDAETELKAFHPSRIMDAYFDRTVALLSDHHIPIYFIQCPSNEASVPYYWPGLKPAVQDYLAGYAARYPQFHLLGDLFQVYPSTDFSDQTHLNPDGTARWTAHVIELLNAAGAPGSPFGPH